MKILAICSGGIDSISIASRYLQEDLTLITFNYGQKGIKELEIVKEFGMMYDLKVIEVDISFMKNLYGKSNQLTSNNVKVERNYTDSVVVPLRNGIFLQIAMAYAYSHGFSKVILGSHLGDTLEDEARERLYPDCSYEFFKMFEVTARIGTKKYKQKVEIETPSTLMMTKEDVVREGYRNLGDFIFKTWSCYRSLDKQCGICEACVNRRETFKKIGIDDKTRYEE